MKRVALLIGVVSFALSAPFSFGETENCTPITSLPSVIDAQGLYCLTGHLSTAITIGYAITINANNVVIDLNGWKLGGQAAGSGTQAKGIYSAASNITVKNGVVRGFYDGVFLTGRGARVEDLLADQNTHYGIHVEGLGALVKNNQIIDTGGSTTISNMSCWGISVNGPGSLVEGNMVSGLAAIGNGGESGITVWGNADNSVVRGNTVTDDSRPAGTGSSHGIRMSGALSVAVIGNSVTNFDYGVMYDNLADGTYAQNVTVNCDTKYFNGTAGSDND
jgi:hypothetical protein